MSAAVSIVYEVVFLYNKKDIIIGRRFKTQEEAKLVIVEYVETLITVRGYILAWGICL
jgi:hypothetical protein